MTTIVQKPSPINLSGNLPEFILFSDNSVNFVLKTGNNELFSSTYTPGSNRKIIINVKELIESVLIFQFRDILEIYTQDTLVGNFTAYINDEKIADFKVIKGGVSNFGMTAETFLQQHFLTWQPRNKKISYSSPEYLSYYAIADCRIKLKAYISNTLSESVETTELVLSELKEGNIYTIPMMYAYISGKLNKYPSSYDVWIESTDGSIRYSYIQRYEYEQRKSEQEEFIIFENSLGGIDCFRAYGNTVFNAENTHNIATINEQLNEYRIDTEYKYTKNTGYLNQYEMKWLKDFFPSTGKYIFKDNILRKIVITEDNVSSSEQDAVGSYEFTYKYADDNIYLNLPINQNSNTLISPMSIQSDNIDTILDLEPRMAEFPMQKLSEGSLFPVQEPFSERWHATNAGAIANYIIDKINQLTDGRLLDNRFKGYFLTETSLKESYPNPLYGDSAWVGEPFPGVVYTVENGEWKTSGKAPEFGDVKLEDYATKEELTELDYKKIQIKGEFVWSDYFYNEGSKEIVKISSESNYRALIFNPIRNSNYVIKNVVDGFLGKFVYYKGSINNATFVSEQSISDGVIFTTPDTDFDFALANVKNVLSGLPYIGKMKFYLLNNTEKNELSLDILDNVIELIKEDYTSFKKTGAYINENGDIVNHENFEYIATKVKEGDIFTINCKTDNSSSVGAVGILIDGTAIVLADGNYIYDSFTFVIPDNCYELRCSSPTHSPLKLVKKYIGKRYIKKSIVDILNEINNGIDFSINQSVDSETGVFTNSDNWIRTEIIPVKEGDIFIYTGQTPNTSPILYLDEKLQRIGNDESLNSSTKYEGKEVEIPFGVSYIVACARNLESDTHSFSKKELNDFVNNINIIGGTDKVSIVLDMIASVSDQLFIGTEKGYAVFRPTKDGISERFYMMPNGSPDGIQTKFETFATDYKKDKVNYSAINWLLYKDVFYLGANIGGEGKHVKQVYGGRFNGSSLIERSPRIEFPSESPDRVRIVGERFNLYKYGEDSLLDFSDNNAAKEFGLIDGDLYRTGDVVKIVHS